MSDPIQEEISYSINLMNQGVKIGREMRQIEIVDLLKEELCGNPDCASTYEHAHCQVVAELIRRILGVEREEA